MSPARRTPSLGPSFASLLSLLPLFSFSLRTPPCHSRVPTLCLPPRLYPSSDPNSHPAEENHLLTLFVTSLYRKDFFLNLVLGEEDPHWRLREAVAGSEYGWEGAAKERGVHAGEFLLVSAVKGTGEGRAQNLFGFLCRTLLLSATAVLFSSEKCRQGALLLFV